MTPFALSSCAQEEETLHSELVVRAGCGEGRSKSKPNAQSNAKRQNSLAPLTLLFKLLVIMLLFKFIIAALMGCNSKVSFCVFFARKSLQFLRQFLA